MNYEWRQIRLNPEAANEETQVLSIPIRCPYTCHTCLRYIGVPFETCTGCGDRSGQQRHEVRRWYYDDPEPDAEEEMHEDKSEDYGRVEEGGDKAEAWMFAAAILLAAAIYKWYR